MAAITCDRRKSLIDHTASLVLTKDNVTVHRAAANDIVFINRADCGSVCNGLLFVQFGITYDLPYSTVLTVIIFWEFRAHPFGNGVGENNGWQ